MLRTYGSCPIGGLTRSLASILPCMHAYGCAATCLFDILLLKRSGWHPGRSSFNIACHGRTVKISVSFGSIMDMIERHSSEGFTHDSYIKHDNRLGTACVYAMCQADDRIRIRLHLFQPHQADQMPGCHWTSQFHKRTSCLNMHE